MPLVAWRAVAVLLVLGMAAGSGWVLGARAERARLAGRTEAAVVARGQCEQRETDLQAQLRVAAAAAADRQDRAAAAGRRPPPAPTIELVDMLKNHPQAAGDDCKEAAALLYEYHRDSVRLRGSGDGWIGSK